MHRKNKNKTKRSAVELTDSNTREEHGHMDSWGCCMLFFLPGPCSVYSGHNRHQTWQNCLSPIITAAVCRATETKHPTGHYIDAALDRSTESSHQTSSGTKWQITPLSCLSLSLRFSLSLPLSLSLSLSLPPFAFLDLFVSPLPFNKLSLLCPFSPVVSHLTLLASLLQTALSVFHSAFIFCPSSLSSHFHIPPSPWIYLSHCPSHPVISAGLTAQ